MDVQGMVDILNELGPVLGVLAVVLGTVVAGLFQAKVAGDQADRSHDSQLKLLEKTHAQSLKLLELQQRREEDLRIRQFEESDRADRLLVLEYVDLLLPRLHSMAIIDYLASDNKNRDELNRFQTLQKYMMVDDSDPAHPERTLGLRVSFLLFQLAAAMRLALNARWTRPLTDAQIEFLSHWEKDLEPAFCSGRYPGKELLYREQIEILTQEMLVEVSATGITRPMNWKDFCHKYETDRVISELADLTTEKVRWIFDEDKSLPPRKAMQCRLAIMALYLIELSTESGYDHWDWMAGSLWDVATNWFKWEQDQGQSPNWFVFEYGDVAARVEAG